MVESLWVAIPVSTVLGFLSGLGTGGGSLLIIWLTLIAGMSPSDARAINLLFFIPSALVACWFRWRQGSLNFKNAAPAIVAGCVSAFLFSWVSTMLDTQILEKLFGGLLLYAGIREIKYKEKKRNTGAG